MARGYAVFTVFNKLKAKDIYFQVKGYEVPGDYTQDVIEGLRKNFKKARFQLNQSNQSINKSAFGNSQSGVKRSMSRHNDKL